MSSMETENFGAPFALMPNRALVPAKTSRATWAGLFVSLFAMVVIRQVTIPLVIFSLGHWSGGAANILIAFAAGAILKGFYLWRRDLVANMIGHGLVDFVTNILPRLFS